MGFLLNTESLFIEFVVEEGLLQNIKGQIDIRRQKIDTHAETIVAREFVEAGSNAFNGLGNFLGRSLYSILGE